MTWSSCASARASTRSWWRQVRNMLVADLRADAKQCESSLELCKPRGFIADPEFVLIAIQETRAEPAVSAHPPLRAVR